MTAISPVEADQRVGNSWFSGYANAVELVAEPVVVAQRPPADGAEYVIYDRGLTVKGTLDLGSDVHSIIVVRGTLAAKRVILGDAVLVVTERVIARDWVFGPRNEGLFDVGGHQIEGNAERLLAAIDAPVVAIFDRNRREFALRDRGAARTAADLVPDVLDMDEVDQRKLRDRLVAGKPVFAGATKRAKPKAAKPKAAKPKAAKPKKTAKPAKAKARRAAKRR
jgi:hypothetical protein